MSIGWFSNRGPFGTCLFGNGKPCSAQITAEIISGRELEACPKQITVGEANRQRQGASTMTCSSRPIGCDGEELTNTAEYVAIAAAGYPPPLSTQPKQSLRTPMRVLRTPGRHVVRGDRAATVVSGTNGMHR